MDRWLRQRRSRHPVVLTVRTPSHQAGDVPEFTSRPVIDQQHGARDIAARSAKKTDAKRIRLSATPAEAGAFRAVAPWEALSSQAPTRMHDEPHGANPGQAS